MTSLGALLKRGWKECNQGHLYNGESCRFCKYIPPDILLSSRGVLYRILQGLKERGHIA